MSHDEDKRPEARANDDPANPEPPLSWKREHHGHSAPVAHADEAEESPVKTGAVGKQQFELKSTELDDFKRARRYTMAAQIMAIASLFLGGVILSGVALLLGVLAYSKLNKIAMARTGEPDIQHALRRSGVMAIVVSAIALALNAITVVFLYPYLSEIMQSASLGTLSGTSASTNAGSGSATWG